MRPGNNHFGKQLNRRYRLFAIARAVIPRTPGRFLKPHPKSILSRSSNGSVASKGRKYLIFRWELTDTLSASLAVSSPDTQVTPGAVAGLPGMSIVKVGPLE